jgi:hypothetical protein
LQCWGWNSRALYMLGMHCTTHWAASQPTITFIFLCDWSLNSGLCVSKPGALLLEPHLQSILLYYFGDGVLQTIILEMESCKLLCPGCPGSLILLILASQKARITGMSHWHWAIITIL